MDPLFVTDSRATTLRLYRLILALYWISLAVGSHWPRLSLFPPPESEPAFQADKVLHVLAYAGLTWLMIRARIAGRASRPVTTALAVGCMALVYAGLDELTQVWAERDVTFSDFSASSVGILAVVVIAATGLGRRGSPRPLQVRRHRVMVFVVGMIAMALVPALVDMAYPQIQALAGPLAWIDKLYHFVVALTMTWLLASACPAGIRRPRLGAGVTIVVMGLSAPMLEAARAYSGPGVRSAAIYAHELGLLAALMIWACLSIGRAWQADKPAIDSSV